MLSWQPLTLSRQKKYSISTCPCWNNETRSNFKLKQWIVYLLNKIARNPNWLANISHFGKLNQSCNEERGVAKQSWLNYSVRFKLNCYQGNKINTLGVDKYLLSNGTSTVSLNRYLILIRFSISLLSLAFRDQQFNRQIQIQVAKCKFKVMWSLSLHWINNKSWALWIWKLDRFVP